MTRTLLAVAAVVALTGCGLLPRKPEPTPPPRIVDCAPEALVPCRLTRYVLPPGDIPADLAAALARAARAAECECAIRHTAALNCISAHNGSGRESPAPCKIPPTTPTTPTTPKESLDGVHRTTEAGTPRAQPPQGGPAGAHQD